MGAARKLEKTIALAVRSVDRSTRPTKTVIQVCGLLHHSGRTQSSSRILRRLGRAEKLKHVHFDKSVRTLIALEIRSIERNPTLFKPLDIKEASHGLVRTGFQAALQSSVDFYCFKCCATGINRFAARRFQKRWVSLTVNKSWTNSNNCTHVHDTRISSYLLYPTYKNQNPRLWAIASRRAHSIIFE